MGHVVDSLITFSNSCSQPCSWHLNSSTFTANRVFPVGLLRSGISSKSSLLCTVLQFRRILGRFQSFCYLRCNAEKSKRLVVTLTSIVFFEQAFEHRVGWRHTCEQSCTRLQFQVVGRTEDFRRGSALDAHHRLHTLQQPGSEDWMIQVCLGFLYALDRKVL